MHPPRHYIKTTTRPAATRPPTPTAVARGALAGDAVVVVDGIAVVVVIPPLEDMMITVAVGMLPRPLVVMAS